jgi:hypothetical protein
MNSPKSLQKITPKAGFYCQSVKFFIRHKDKKESAIRAIVSFFGKQYPVAIGVSVKPRFWNQQKCRCRTDREYPEARHINERLDEWEKLLKEIAKNYEIKIVAPDMHDFKEAITRALKIRSGADGEKTPYLIEFAENYKKNCSKNNSTKKNYGVTIEHLFRYENKFKTRLKFEHITLDFYNSLRNHLLQQTYEKNGEKQHYAKNTIGSVIKNLRLFFNEARRAGHHNFTLEGFKVEQEEVDNIYLTTDELVRLHNLNITSELIFEKLNVIVEQYNDLQRKIDALNDNKDRFLIGAFTAMRYGDYSGLENLKHTDKFITKRTQKTGTKVVIPMHWVIREILEKRENVLPRAVSNQKLNDALKELGQLADLAEEVEITVTRGGKRVTTRRPKYELISTHTARRSGCTNMYLAGIDIYTIMGFSGHTTEQSFRKYIKIKQEENAQRFIEHPFFNKSTHFSRT